MAKLNLAHLRMDIFNGLQKHSPEILIGIGIAGFVTSTVLAVRATPKALEKIKVKENKKKKKLTKVETVKTTWTCYIPSLATALLSMACIVGASKISYQRNAALAAAYAFSEQALRTYQQKVVETIGETKEKQIYDSINEDKIKSHPVIQSEVIFLDGCNTLCYDPWREKYFMVNLDKVRNGISDLNFQMHDEMFVSLNDAYCHMGLPPILTDEDMGNFGERFGWSTDDGTIRPKPTYSGSDSGMPCMVLGFDPPPRANYMG